MSRSMDMAGIHSCIFLFDCSDIGHRSSSRGLSVSHGMCGTKVTFEQESVVGAALATLLSIYISRHMIPRHCCDGRAAIATIAARQCAFHRPAPAAAPMTAAMAAGCHAHAAPASFIFLLLASDVGGVVSIQI